MKLIRAIIRPDRENKIVAELDKLGLGAMTKVNVFGQGREKCGEETPVEWDESLTKHNASQKVLLMLVAEDDDVETMVSVIMNAAKTGNIGDGKIFISNIEGAYTIGAKMAIL